MNRQIARLIALILLFLLAIFSIHLLHSMADPYEETNLFFQGINQHSGDGKDRD
jgi:hypothetical protein